MKLRTSKSCLTAALLCLAAVGGIAAPITVPDFSFELFEVADGASTAAPNVGTNWTAAGNGGVFLRNPQDDQFAGATGEPGTLLAPAGGTNCLIINLGFPGYCWQRIGPVQPNTIYTLTVAVGHTLISSGGLGKIALVNGSTPFDTILGATPVDGDTVTAGAFADSTLVFTTGQQVSGQLTILLQGDTGSQLVFDNVRLDASPAPQAPTALVPAVTPSTNVYVGTLVTLNEDPAGALPFHYQWQSDNGSAGVSFTDVAAANSANLVVDTTSFTPGAPIQYRVVVTNSFGGSTSAPVALTAINSAPVITADTIPSTGSDIVGSAVTFKASFDGSRPISYQWQFNSVDIPDATNTTLTITNLQLSDSGSYSLKAENAISTTYSTASSFTVNPVPDANNAVITAIATQLGLGGATKFTPTWTVAANSLIAGVAPSAIGTGNFSQDASGVVAALTDGKYGTLFPAGNGSADFVTCGPNGGRSVTYPLPASATGYDLTNIVIYGGWSDAGRDAQRYIVYYSTVASPNNFNNQIAEVGFNPANPAAVQSSMRITLTSTNGALAKNVAAVLIDFNILDQSVENGYAGYSEIGMSGVPSAPAPVLAQDIKPITGSDVVGSTVTFTAAFGSSNPVTYQWKKDEVAIPNATNTSLTISNLQLADTGSYRLTASNSSGIASSSAGSFTVNPVPDPDGNNIIASPANQTGSGLFTPTWTIATSSLITGVLPSAGGGGNFGNEGGGGPRVLTDGVFGAVGGAQNATLATAGNNAGNSLTYTLTGAAAGYDLTNIVVYGGWSDGGRDELHFTVSYATVDAPANFIPITSASYNPSLPGSVPSADRLTIALATPGALATHVAKVMIDFTNPGGENGWSGYAEISLLGSPSAPLANFAPVIVSDLVPATGSDVVGSFVTFRAIFNGTSPITYQWQKDTVDILGATNATLTLTNLQLIDTGSYHVIASNVSGSTPSSDGTFTVNPVPAAVGNIIVAPANQTASGQALFPTWTLLPGSLIAGTSPSTVGSGNFANEGGGGTTVLTDNTLGLTGAGNSTLATAGSGAGSTVTYTLAGSASGYDLTSIVAHGGWGDGGRDQLHFTVSYSTAAAPDTFTTLTSADYNPTLPGSVPSADRVTITSATAAPLATGVARVRFDFTTPGGENGWSGYSEIGVFGVVSAPQTPPTINSVAVSGGNLILTGAGGTPGGSYTWLTSTNVAAPVANWTTNSAGVFDGSGAFSNAIPINATEAARYFRLKTP